MKRALTMLPLLPFALFLVILPFPGTVAARLLLLTLCGGVALWQWRQHPEARPAVPCGRTLAVWAALCLASLAYAVDPAYTLGELKNEIGYTLMAFFAFFAIAREPADARLILRALLLGLFLIGGWATLAWLRHGFIWVEGGGHGGIGIFATYLITLVPALAWLALTEDARSWRGMATVGLVFALFLAAITLQRAVWPVLAVQALLLAKFMSRTRRLRLNRGQWALAMAAVVLIATAGLTAQQARRFSGAEAQVSALSADTRLLFWPGVVARIASHPVVGAGFGREAMKRAYPELIPAYNTMLWHPHNVFLVYGIGMGLPGVLALLGLFVCWGRFFWRAARGVAPVAGAAGLALVAGVVLRNQFNDFFFRDMSLLFWALTGLLARLAMTAKGDAA